MADVAEVKGTYNRKQFKLKLVVKEVGDKVSVSLQLLFEGSDYQAEVVADLGRSPRAISIPTFTVDHSVIAMCLATCGLKTLVPPVWDCIQSTSTIPEFVDCIKSKGVAIISSALACLLECLYKGATGPSAGSI